MDQQASKPDFSQRLEELIKSFQGKGPQSATLRIPEIELPQVEKLPLDSILDEKFSTPHAKLVREVAALHRTVEGAEKRAKGAERRAARRTWLLVAVTLIGLGVGALLAQLLL